MSTFYEQATVGEVWCEADGCLVTAGPNGWYAFGYERIVPESEMELPLTKVIDYNGTILIDKIPYPEGRAVLNA